MLDLSHMSQYRESNRLEAKLATGGLPESIWETYSAFANTYGGVILLGVEELPDRTLRIQGLLNPEDMREELLTMADDPEVASVNLLTRAQVQVSHTPQGAVLAVHVPRAGADVRPVYVGGNLYRGTYRRVGDADMHCTKAEVDAMLQARDSTLDPH